MTTCKECVHYTEIDDKEGYGACFGAEVPGDRDIKKSPKCGGKYFKPKEQ